MKKFYLFLTTACVLFIVSASFASNPEDFPNDKKRKFSDNFVSNDDPKSKGAKTSKGSDLTSLEEAAKRGSRNAQYDLGILYWLGKGVQKNPQKAIEFFEKAAKSGHVQALCDLGVIYNFGREVEKDPQKAMEFLREASDKGHPYAHHELGRMYALGLGGEINFEKAKELFESAYEKEELREAVKKFLNNLRTLYFGDGDISNFKTNYLGACNFFLATHEKFGLPSIVTLNPIQKDFESEKALVDQKKEETLSLVSDLSYKHGLTYGLASNSGFIDSNPDEEEVIFYKKLLDIEEKLATFLNSDLVGFNITNLSFNVSDNSSHNSTLRKTLLIIGALSYQEGKNQESIIRTYKSPSKVIPFNPLLQQLPNNCLGKVWSYGKEAVENADNLQELLSKDKTNEKSIAFAIHGLTNKIEIYKTAVNLEKSKILIQRTRKQLAFDVTLKELEESTAVVKVLEQKIKDYTGEIQTFKKIETDILDMIGGSQNYRNEISYDYYVKGLREKK